MTKEEIIVLKKARLQKMLSRADIKSYGAINKVRRELRKLEN